MVGVCAVCACVLCVSCVCVCLFVTVSFTINLVVVVRLRFFRGCDAELVPGRLLVDLGRLLSDLPVVCQGSVRNFRQPTKHLSQGINPGKTTEII